MKRCIPIDRFVVTFGCHNFWSKIVWGSAERPGDVWNIFSKSEISNLDMAMTVEEEVFGLEIAVDNVLSMQILES